MRQNNRQNDELRKVEIIPNFNPYAEGSCLIKSGNTHVICTASVEDKVPAWLKDEGKGWITAEYAMLPRATLTRTPRETLKPSGRSQEIKRLIGRALRAGVDLTKMPDISVIIDCDVIQADGGTRTASVTGGFVALYLALWLRGENFPKTQLENLWRLFLAVFITGKLFWMKIMKKILMPKPIRILCLPKADVLWKFKVRQKKNLLIMNSFFL